MKAATGLKPVGRIRKRRKLYLILTAVILALLAVTAFVLLRNSSEAKAREYSQRARECYNNADYETALLYLRRAMAEGEDPELLMLMADCYEAMENYPRALETLRRMNTADPAIASRIQYIEQKRNSQTNAGRVSVAGLDFDRDTKSAVLDGKNITDAQLSEVAALYALESLSLRNNMLTEIGAIATLGGLDELDLSGNQIRNVNGLAGIHGLRSLNLSGNPITECSSLKELTNLNTLNLTNTSVSEDDLALLSEAIPHCAIRVTADNTEEILYGNNRFQADATELQLSGMGLEEIGALEEFTEVRILNLSNNEIGDLRPLMRLSKLESLNLSGNEVSDLRPLMGLPRLKKLDVSNNLIIETSTVGAMGTLEELNLSGNRIGNFSGLEKLKKLTDLDLSGTGVKDAVLAELYGLRSLLRLNLKENSGLSDKAVSALKSELRGCNILTSELIYEIDLAGHTVRSDEKHLAFPSSGISDLSGLSRLNRLEELDLSNNEISNLYMFEVCACRESLKTLNLSNNRISDVSSLGALTSLEELDLSDNQIEIAVGLARITTLKRLNLSGNPLLEEPLKTLREALPNCEIIVG